MLDSLQPQRNPNLIIILSFSIEVLMLLSLTSAFEFGISPAELTFEGLEGEEICKGVKIFSSLNQIDIDLMDKWTLEKYSKEISKYGLGSNDLNLKLNYPDKISLGNKRDLKICLNSEDAGNFKGVLIFQALDKNLNIGLWLNANISKKSEASKITGFSINESGTLGSVNIFMPLTILNLFLLLGLFFIYKRKKINMQNN